MIAELFTHLRTIPAINNRAYAAYAPQDVANPYIVFRLIAGSRRYSHDGFSSLSVDRVQVSVYADTYATARGVADEVINRMESWATAQATFMASQVDIYEEETKLYHIPVDYEVWHNM